MLSINIIINVVSKAYQISYLVDDVFLDYFIKYNVRRVFCVVQTWLENDSNESPEEIVSIINNIVAFHP